MTTVIPHLASVSILGAGSEPPAGNRVVPVNRQALALFNRIGLVPPDAGQFNPAELDAKLSGLDISTRMAVKNHLTTAGLLPIGRQPDLTRR